MTNESHEYPASYYHASAVGLIDYPALQGEQACDVCVVGGGYAGLSTALHLSRKGYKVILLESRRVGWGASGRNGGQLGSGQRKDNDELEKLTSKSVARELWQLAEEAKDTAKALIEEFAIDCDLKSGKISAGYKPSHAKHLMDYADYLNEEYGYDQIRGVSKQEMGEMLGTDIYFGGSLDSGAAHLHPLNYALGLARAATTCGAEIFEKSPVTEIQRSSQRTLVKLRDGTVNARYVAVCCNGYLGSLLPELASRIMPINNFIIATSPLGEATARQIIRDDVAVADSKFVVDYFRLSRDHRLLFGGGETYTRRFPTDIKSFVRKYMLKVFPQLDTVPIEYGWGGTLAITLNRMPSVGRLEGDIYYTQGFSGHGVAMATLMGKLSAEAIAGTAERFDLFASLPQPRFPGGTLLRWPGMVAGMFYYAMRDRL